MLKFSPLAPISIRTACICIVLTALFASPGLPARAQTPTPAPTKPKQAFVRFWDMMPGPSSTVLVLLNGDKSISDASSCNFLARYVPVTPGAYAFTIRRGNDPNGILKRLPANLAADAKVTILVSGSENQPDVQLIDDTIDPKVPPTGRLVVRQFLPNAKVMVSTAGGAATPTLGYGETATLDNLPLAQGTLTTKFSVPGKADKNTSMLLDLTQYPHGTLLIFQDAYGSVHPRLAVDGQAVAEQGRGEGDRR